MTKPTKAKASSPLGKRKRQSGGWMTASPAAWVGLIVGVIAIGSSVGQWMFTYARLEGRVDRVHEEIARNFREDEYHRERNIKAIERLDTNLSGLTQMEVKIGKLETQLTNITDLLKRVESRLDRSSRTGK